jgi:hypothetical protein
LEAHESSELVEDAIGDKSKTRTALTISVFAMVQAKGHEATRDHALRQDPWFDYAEGMLQIAIVLLSVSMIGSIPALFYVGTLLGSLGFLATVNGYFLLI